MASYRSRTPGTVEINVNVGQNYEPKRLIETIQHDWPAANHWNPKQDPRHNQIPATIKRRTLELEIRRDRIRATQPQTGTARTVAELVYLSMRHNQNIREWRPSTAAQHWGRYRNWIEKDPTLTNLTIASTRTIDLQRWIDQLDCSQQLGVTLTQTIREAFEYALRTNMWTGENPARPVRSERKRQPKRTPQIPTTEQTRQFLQHDFGNQYDRTFYRFAAGTGCRIGEACALRWDRVNIQSRTVMIDATVTRGEDGETIGPPKSAASLRSFIIPQWVCDDLQRWRDNSIRLWRAALNGEPPVFVWWYQNDHEETDSKPARTATMRTRWEYHRETLGLDRMVMHDWRHWHATWLAAHGVDDASAARRLGHTPEMFRSTYKHALLEADASVAERLADIAPGL